MTVTIFGESVHVVQPDRPDRAGWLDVLLIEDDPVDAVMVRALLAEALGVAHRCVWARTLADGRAALGDSSPSCVLLDLGLPDCDGLATLNEIVAAVPDTAIVVFTGLDDDRAGREAVMRGAQDYLVKGKTDASLLVRAMRYAVGRKQAEAARRRSEDRLRLATKQIVYNRSLIEASADALFAIGPDGLITDVNEAATRLSGYSRRHLTNLRFAELFTDPDRAQAGVEHTFAESRAFGYELELNSASGQRIMVSFNAGAFFDAAGNPLGILVVARDVTDQKELERQLRSQQSYTRSLIESNIDALMATDPLGTITDVNQQMETLTGRNRDELIGSPFKDHFTDPGAAEEGIRLVVRDGSVTNHELKARSADGRETVVSYNASTFFDEHGTLQGVFVAARDVTERNRAEAALVESEERFQQLVASMNDVFFLRSTDPFEFLYISPAAEAVFGVNPEVVYRDPQAFLSIVHPEDAARVHEQLMQRSASRSGLSEIEYRIVRPDGDVRWIRARAAPARVENGTVTRIAGTVEDITDRKATELALRAAQEAAARANRAKSEFLSRMSHELRTPLNAILGFAQLLEMDELTGETAERVAQINRAGRHLLGLINEVLDISRIEAGQVELSAEPVQLAGILDETLSLVAGLREQFGVDTRLDVPADQWALADRQRLKQILLNLLSNAIKYNRPGGSISVTSTVAGGRLQIRVDDTGEGIPDARLAELFVPFNRLGADSSGVEGSGLGLSLSKALAEAMGGRLSLEATSPEGTTFLLEVPVAEPTARDARADARSAAGHAEAEHRQRPVGDHTILHIEDNPANVDLLEAILSTRPDVTVIASIQGSVGLDLARTERPSLVLLDLHLPDMSGEEVLRHLKRDPDTAAIPVVILTADAINATPERFTALGARAFLTKPIDVTRLREAIDTVLREVESP